MRICVIVVALCFVHGAVAEHQIAFLSAETGRAQMGPHEQGAWETAKKLRCATLLFVNGEGGFVDASGGARTLDTFDVVWYHQGDAIARNALYGGAYLSAIRRFAEDGGGVLFSGGALAMVDHLGLEPIIRAQRHDLENYRDPAALVPAETAHPVFDGLRVEDGLVWLSNGGCRAVADFYWGGPAEGMLLGNTPDGVRRPLVEYELGAGRLIVFGGRWPDYADFENPHRDNLLRLTANLLDYLADARQWRPVTVRTKFPALAYPEEPGIAPSR
ncbi:MAG TPA: hypothetical protein ENN29_00880, partial [Candidatus Hydrogenedentes bacterium]|nr:hypothetical protein [Candidatus Hydrogenedentota bacterium]